MKCFIVAGMLAFANSGHTIDFDVPRSFVPQNFKDGIPYLGGGFDSHRQKFTGRRCVEFNKDVIELSGGSSGMIELKYRKDLDRLRMELGLDVAGKLSLEIISVGGAASLAMEIVDDDLTKTFVFESSFNSKTLGHVGRKTGPGEGKIFLNDLGKEAKDKPEDEKREVCGDYMIQGVSLGAKFITAVQLSFATNDLKTKFEASIDVDLVDIIEISGKARNFLETHGDQVSINIRAFQLGGNPAEMLDILGSAGNSNRDTTDDIYLLKCGISDTAIQNCVKALELIVKYAHTNFKNQIKDMSYDFTSPKGMAVTGYVLETYKRLGVYELYRNYPPLMDARVKDAREDLLNMYLKFDRDHKRLLRIRDMHLTQEEESLFSEIEDKIKHNKDVVYETLDKCYNFIGDVCLKPYKDINDHLKKYDPNKIVKTITFLDYCTIPKKSDGLKKTVDELFNFIGMDEQTDNCEKAFEALKEENNITLSGRGVSFLEPLLGLPNVEELEVDHNQIVDLSPLQHLKKLRYLNISHNKVRNIRAISGLENLEWVNASDNLYIRDATPLYGLIKLQEVYLHGNQWDFGHKPVEVELAKFKSSEIKLGKKISVMQIDACNLKRSQTLFDGKIRASTYENAVNKGLYPFIQSQGRNAYEINGWGDCEKAIATYFFY
ncbi:MAG: leucine-rich repeat domain-containing protein [Bdellovibrio sp.]|nr:leucine-rich repeat domain-containing protein [Bdellovibrio sp.]